ncbi:MAG: hypothetical protein DME62_10800 [Verrucomicrobia bacterium]|nr:MAG: hypothetical protein DME62_10800 [Verrucomicrobiota bacterium]
MAGVFKSKDSNAYEQSHYLRIAGSLKGKGRDTLEIAVYVMCVLSAIGAIWQFAWQPAPLPLDAISWESYAPQHVSHHQTGAFWFRKS